MIDWRLLHFIRKEFFQIRRDRWLLINVLAIPMIQLLILGYTATTDIRHVRTAVLTGKNTYYERTYLDAFQNSGYFDFNYRLRDDDDIHWLLDRGRAKVALRLPVDFGRRLVRGETAGVQAVIDGTNSSAATIIAGYLEQINFTAARKITAERLAARGLGLKAIDLFDPQVRVWYNPQLTSVNYMVPAIFALLIMIETMILTSASIIKERERGTMEMLLATPIRPPELILGKLLPAVLISYLDIILCLLVATFWFQVPLRGDLLLFFLLSGIFISTGLGLGMFISTISTSQRQAVMAVLFVLIPSIVISGYIFPIANMPRFIQAITYLIPVRYYLVIVRGMFMKGIGLEYLWVEVWPLLLFAFIAISLSVLRFRGKLE
jgi:ABC-2 type transport system permease protein